MANINNLGNKVTTRTYSWEELVMRNWGSEFHAPDHKIYQFSGGNNKDSTDMGKTGIYGISGQNYLMLEDSNAHDMASKSHLLQSNGFRLQLE